VGLGPDPDEEAELWGRVQRYRAGVEQLTTAVMGRLESFLDSVDTWAATRDRFRALAQIAVRAAVEHHCGEGGPPSVARAYTTLNERVALLPGRWRQGHGEEGTQLRLACTKFEECLNTSGPTEDKLWRLIGDGADALNRLLGRYLPLAYQVALRHRGRRVDLQDLRQQAFLGLREAALRYRPAEGTQFSTAATPVIRSRLRDYIREAAGFGSHAPRQQAAFEAEHSRLAGEMGRLPSEDEVYGALNWSDRERETHRRARRLLLQGEADGEVVYGVADPSGASPTTHAEARDEAERLHTALDRLEDPARQVLFDRYLAEEPLSQRALARQMGVTRDRVQQLEKDAMGQMARLLGDAGPALRNPSSGADDGFGPPIAG
jgi:RNA polymerase sigma factor (sigma-70 family)